MPYVEFKGFLPNKKEKKALEFYTENGTYLVVTDLMKKVSEQEWNSNLLYYTNNTNVNKIIRDLETILYEVRYSEMSKSFLVKALWDLRNFIAETNSYPELNYLFYVIYERSCSRKAKNSIYLVCMSLLLDLAAYCYGSAVPLYTDSNGALIVETGVNQALIDRSEQSRSLNAVSPYQKELLHAESTLRSRILLVNFLKKTDTYLWKNTLAGVHPIIPNLDQWGTNDLLKQQLEVRTKFLPSPGLFMTVEHVTGLESIYLQEKIYDNGKVVLLFSLCNSEGFHIIGFYENTTKVFYSCINDGKMVNDKGRIISIPFDIENFVLQIYVFLSTSFVPTFLRNQAIRIFETEEEYCRGHKKFQPTVIKRFSSISKEESWDEESIHNTKSTELKEIRPHFRKLAVGWQASEEARQNAIKYGYLIPAGYTFVTGFEKCIWVNTET